MCRRTRTVLVSTCEGFCAPGVLFLRRYSHDIIARFIVQYRHQRGLLRLMVEKNESKGREFLGIAGIFRRLFLSLFLEPS